MPGPNGNGSMFRKAASVAGAEAVSLAKKWAAPYVTQPATMGLSKMAGTALSAAEVGSGPEGWLVSSAISTGLTRGQSTTPQIKKEGLARGSPQFVQAFGAVSQATQRINSVPSDAATRIKQRLNGGAKG